MQTLLLRAFLALCLLAFGVCFFFPYTSMKFTCIYCRAFKQVAMYGYIPIESVSNTTCSEWYTKSFPLHEHHWARSSGIYKRNGFDVGCACGLGPSIWLIAPDTQRKF